MRYRLRTLLILLPIGPPLLSLGWLPFWHSYDMATREVEQQRLEWDAAKWRTNGSPHAAAGVRHAQLNWQRQHQNAQEKSLLYRYWHAQPENLP